MGISKKVGVFPLFTIFAGALGYGLRFWLLSLENKFTGLLPRDHIAGILTLVLLVLTMVICLLAVRGAPKVTEYSQLFPPSPVATIGGMVGALGLGFSAFAVEGVGVLAYGLPIFGVLSTVALVVAAWYRFTGRKPVALPYCVVAVFFMLRLVAWCRVWGTEPQLHYYLFDLLASLSLLLACYYRAEVCVDLKHYRSYAFFSQIALFCCMLCLTDREWTFYLSAGIWMASDFCVLPAYSGRYQ